MRFGVWGAVAALWAGTAWAAGPDGAGWIAVDGTMAPAAIGVDTPYIGGQFLESQDTAYALELRGGFDPFQGFGVRAALGYSLSTSTDANGFDIPGLGSEFDSERYQHRDQSQSLSVQAYPGAWFGSPFVPGRTANADGWIFWPSLSVGVVQTEISSRTSESNSLIDFGEGGYSYGWTAGNSVFQADEAESMQQLEVACAYPLCPEFSLRADYARVLADHASSGTLVSFNNDLGETTESEGVGMVAYVDLVQGAGADPSRAFLPGLGRTGQLEMALNYGRVVDFFENSLSQSIRLELGVPMSDQMGIQVGVWWQETALDGLWPLGPGVTYERTLTYQLGLSWAFGDPSHREGRI